MTQPSKPGKYLNLIYFVESGKARSAQLPLFLIYFVIFLCLGVLSTLGFFIYHSQIQTEDIGQLESRILNLKKTIFSYQVTYQNILNRGYQKSSAKAKVAKTQPFNRKPTPIIPKAPKAKAEVKKAKPILTKSKVSKPKKVSSINSSVKSPPPTQSVKPKGSIGAAIDVTSVKFKESGLKHTLTFRLNNTQKSGIAYRGYIIAKARQLDPITNELITLSIYPKRAKLESGMVKNPTQGYLFRISKYKDFKVGLRDLQSDAKYTDVTFFIYSDSRKPIYERTFSSKYY